MSFDVKTLSGLTQDSRAVKDGYLFAAFPGEKTDGRDYIDAAIDAGASAILAPEGTEIKSDITLLTDKNPRQYFAKIAAEFYAAQPGTIAAVTGTNGKTSVVSFLEQLWSAAGYNAQSLGTLSGNLTTLEPVALHAELAAQAKNGTTHLALEASSHGLNQYRLDGARINIAAFTNLSRDHLDYHGTMEDYLTAKMRLFTEILSPSGTAVLNADISEYEPLKTACEKRNIKTISYGTNAKDIELLSSIPLPHGQDIKLKIFGETHEIILSLIGDFQAMNVLCALGLAVAQDSDHTSKYITALENLSGAPGRLQSVTGHPQNAGIYVDYAHTPDALETVLKSVRPHTSAKLYCVFGCGGDRDKGKRSLMGKIASDLADIAIVTDDNPRSEDPAAIRADIIQGAPNALEIDDRRAAIQTAINKLQAGDVLVIAGKGHEQGQIFATHTEEFDDVHEAQNAIKNLQP